MIKILSPQLFPLFRKCFQVGLLLILLFGLLQTGEAQRTFGVIWESPTLHRGALNEIRTFDSLGIKHLEISRPVDYRILDHLQANSFKIFLAIPKRFVLPGEKVSTDSVYQANIENLLSHFHSYPHIEGVGLFQFGALQSGNLFRQYNRYATTIRQQTGYPLYFTTAQVPTSEFQSLFDRVFFLYHTQDSTRWSDYDGYIFDGSLLQHPLKELGYLLHQTAPYPNRPVFFKSDWLLKSIDRSPELARYLQTASSDSLAIYPYQQEHDESPLFTNWLVLLFLLTWSSFALHYSISPIYRKNLLRYFFAHEFFIRDILEWRIRIPYTAAILFFQHILIFGLWVYALARHYYTSLGVEALRYHFPLLENLAIWPLSFFLLGLLIAFLIQSIAILLLYVFTSEVNHISQPLLLYSWPLQINLLTATILTPVIISGGSGHVLYMLTILFLLVWIGGYLMTAYDIANFISRGRLLYLLASLGTLTGLIGFGIYYIYIHTALPGLFNMIAKFI